MMLRSAARAIDLYKSDKGIGKEVKTKSNKECCYGSRHEKYKN